MVLDTVLYYLLAASTSLYMTITIATLVRFKMVGSHNGVFAVFMLIVLSSHQLGVVGVDITFNIVCVGVALYTIYNMQERLRHL